MRVAYGSLISTGGFTSTDATDQLLDAIRDEEGIPREEWRPTDRDACLAAFGLSVIDAPEDDDATYERFVLSSAPIDVPDGDPTCSRPRPCRGSTGHTGGSGFPTTPRSTDHVGWTSPTNSPARPCRHP